MTNEEMVVRFQQGEVTFEEILAKNEALVHKELNRWGGFTTMEREDKYNLLLVALWESAQEFDIEAGVRFTTFATNNLYFAMKNAYRSATSKRNGGDVLHVSIEEQLEKETHSFERNVSVDTNYDDHLIANDIEALVEKVLNNYDTKKKQYVRSFLFDNMTYSEIARQFSMRPQQMTTTIKRILDKIQIELINQNYGTVN